MPGGERLSRLLIASRNVAKSREMETILREHLAGIECEMPNLSQFPDYPEPDETGATYAENASIKARSAADALGVLAIADDAGLEIDALGGAPGLHSKRFAGDTTFAEKIAVILERMRDVPNERRAARFRCAVAVAEPRGATHVFEATCEGRIAFAPEGSGGFGYDPIFFLDERGRTMAALRPEEKNAISHRGKTLRAARETLRRLLGNP